MSRLAVTQLVSVYLGKEQLDKSLKVFSTKKIVFLTRKEKLKEVLDLRKEIALKYSIPTEVKTVDSNIKEISELFKEYENPIVHLIDNDYLNYYLLSACSATNTKAYFSNNGEVKEIL